MKHFKNIVKHHETLKHSLFDVMISVLDAATLELSAAISALRVAILAHIFVDLEKAFDKVPRSAIRWALCRQVVPESLIDLVMALYSETRVWVRVARETSDSFGIGVGVHQGSVLSLLLLYLY